MTEGRYVYCIVDSSSAADLGDIGLDKRPAYVVSHKDIGAVVSQVPYVETEASIDHILAHQRVVEAARKLGTALPVKFGTIFRKEEGVKSLLTKSYDDYRGKLATLKGTDEFGVKVLFDKAGLAKIRAHIESTSPEVKKMKKTVEGSSKGKQYFERMKMSEAIRSEAYRKLDELSSEIYKELSKKAEKSALLKAEHEQIILNAAYLVRRADGDAFLAHATGLSKKYADKGLIIHSSGPWAPYSFC